MNRCSVLLGILLALGVSGAPAAAADDAPRSDRSRADDSERGRPRSGEPRCEPGQLHRTDAHYSNLTQYEYYESMEIRGNGCTVYPEIRLRAQAPAPYSSATSGPS